MARSPRSDVIPRAIPVGHPRLVRLNTACEYADMSRSTMYRLIGGGDIIAYKMRANTFVDLDSVDKWMRALPRMMPVAKG
jgi:excisionase family DNA binding protein